MNLRFQWERGLRAGLVALVFTLCVADVVGAPEPAAPVQPHPWELPGTPVVAASSNGYLPSAWSVTPTGQFTYSIPLRVPAGRVGMQPSLALSYSSGGGTGNMGVGWSISGSGSAITRCGRSLPTEGRVDGVDFSEADRFCLDGQKLIAIGGLDYGSGAYGDIDTQYRTESDSFAQIISTGPKTLDGKGPEQFIVRTKNGHRLTYNAVEAMRIATTTDGAVKEVGTIRVQWLLASEVDQVGNAVTYEYDPWMQGNGQQADDYALEIRLTRIRYTSNASTRAPGYRYVEFEYEALPAIEREEPSWQSGIAHTRTGRIKTIAMYAPNPTTTAKVWQYNLTYAPSNSSHRSLLKTVQHCATVGGCAWKKQFDWAINSDAPKFVALPPLAAPLYANFQEASSNAQESPSVQVLDLNGDGAQDVVYHAGSASDGFGVPNRVRLGKRGLVGAFVPLSEGPYTIDRSDPDVNSDGYGHVLLGSSYPIDLNGDGQVALFAQVAATNPANAISTTRCSWWTKSWNDSTKKFERAYPGLLCDLRGYRIDNKPIYRFPSVSFGDLDGDGLVDWLYAKNADPADLESYNPQWMVKLNRNNGNPGSLGTEQPTGNSYGIAPNITPNGMSSICLGRITDLDGDGRGDFVAARGSIPSGAIPGSCTNTAAAVSTNDHGVVGKRYANGSPANQPFQDGGAALFSAPSQNRYFGDFNGDGLEDYASVSLPYGDQLPDLGPATGHLYWNTGNGYYLDALSFTVPLDAHPDQAQNRNSNYADRGIRVVDINHDGRDDIVTFHNTPTPTISMLLSRGNGTFQSVDLPVGAGTRLDGKRNKAAFPHFNSGNQTWHGYDPDDMPGLAAGWSLSQLGDFNADGYTDVIRHVGGVNGGYEVLQQTEEFGDRLVAVYDEKTAWPREAIHYSNEWSNNPGGKMTFTCSYPQHCIRGGMTVVRAVTSNVNLVDPPNIQHIVNDGRKFYYSYEDPVSDAQHGFLGFGEFTVWDPAQPVETITTFDQRTRITVSDNPNNPLDQTGSYYPYAGIPKTVTTIVPILTQAQADAQTISLAQARITQTTHTYNFKRLNSGATYVTFPDLDYTNVWQVPTQIAWTPGGADPQHFFGYNISVPPDLSSYTYQQFDNYGNQTFQDGMSFSGGAIGEYTASNTTFENRVDEWLIGLPVAQVVTSKVAAPGAPIKSRHANYHYNDLGQLDTIWMEKGIGADYATTTTLTYAPLGQVSSSTMTTANEVPRTSHTEYGSAFPGAPPEQIYPSQTWFEHSNPDCPADIDCRPSSWFAVHPVYGLVAAMDVNGVQSTLTYDGLGRPVSARSDGEQKITFTHAGRPDAFSGMNGMIETTQIGSNAQMVSEQQFQTISDARGNTLATSMKGFDSKLIETAAHYDLLGRATSVTRPYQGVSSGSTLHQYDSLGRVLSTQMPDTSTVTHTYPTLFEQHTFDAGNNGNLNESYTIVDVDGQLSTSANILIKPNAPPETIKMQFTYGVFGTVESVSDGVHATKMDYDAIGRRIKTEEPDRGTTTLAYNGYGEVRQSDAPLLAGQLQTNTYDDLGRVIEQDSPDGIATFRYDTSAYGVGQLGEATSVDNIVTAYRYDALGRAAGADLIDEALHTYSIDMTYNALTGRLATLAYPEVPGRPRFTAQYHYNARGFLDQVADATPGQPGALLWQVDARNADLALIDGKLGNGAIALHREYDALMGRLTDQAALHAGNNLHSVGYGYWQNGLVKTRVTHDGVAKRTEAFDYDALARLTQWKLAATNPGGPPQVGTPTQYVYDFTGNMTDVNRNGVLIEHRTYDSTQPHTLTNMKTYLGANLQSDTDYIYDALGRMEEDANRKITYSAADLPKTLTRNGQSWTLLYNAMGQRVSKTDADGNSTHYLPGLYERREVGAAVKHVFHVSGTDGTVAQINYDEPKAPAVVGTTSVLYPISDALGSTGVVVDASGNVIERNYYDPFGARIKADGSALGVAPISSVKEGFTGQEHDDDFGLINFKGRMYDPAMKRFLSADPIVSAPGHSQSWNPYSYVMNSPLNLTDPSGYQTQETCSPGRSNDGGKSSVVCTDTNPTTAPDPGAAARAKNAKRVAAVSEAKAAERDATATPEKSDDSGAGTPEGAAAYVALREGKGLTGEEVLHREMKRACDGMGCVFMARNISRNDVHADDIDTQKASIRAMHNGASQFMQSVSSIVNARIPPASGTRAIVLDDAAGDATVLAKRVEAQGGHRIFYFQPPGNGLPVAARFSGPNGTVLTFDTKTNADEVLLGIAEINRNSSVRLNINIGSGTHGDAYGNNANQVPSLADPSFLTEDRSRNPAANNIFDMGNPQQADAFYNGMENDPSSIHCAAWCFSSNGTKY